MNVDVVNKLNLGSGEFRKEGYINLDFESAGQPDIIHNLNVFPYPFEPDSFDRVEADHVIEHLDSPFDVMREIHRISRHGGTVIIRVPHFSRGFTHPEHCRGFDVSFPYYFNPSFRGGYQGVVYELTSSRLRWMAQPWLKKEILGSISLRIGALISSVVDFFANLSPVICSRFWCFFVGGFEEIEFRFVVKK